MKTDITIKTFFPGANTWVFYSDLNLTADDGLTEGEMKASDKGRGGQHKYYANAETMRMLQRQYSMSWEKNNALQIRKPFEP